MAKPLLKKKAAADYIGITERHLRDLVTRREIPFIPVGRFHMFDTDDLDAWLETNKVEALEPQG